MSFDNLIYFGGFLQLNIIAILVVKGNMFGFIRSCMDKLTFMCLLIRFCSKRLSPNNLIITAFYALISVLTSSDLLSLQLFEGHILVKIT